MSDVHEFGPFRLDLPEHRLLRLGEPVPLTPKAFLVLATLVARRGHLVTRSELIALVWPDVVVEEGNLSYCISLVRKALGDDTAPHRYIETVPKQGYRFLGAMYRPDDVAPEAPPPVLANPASLESDASAAGAATGDEPLHVRSRVWSRRRRRGVVAAAAMAVGIVAASGALGPGSGPDHDRPSTGAHAAQPALLEATAAVGAGEVKSRGDFDRRRLALSRAIALDPTFARAQASLASLYMLAINQGLIGPPAAIYPLARAAALRAIELDPASPEAHAAAGRVALNADWDWRAADAYLRRAVELNPGSVEAQRALRYYLTLSGRHREALAALRRAREIDPVATNYPALLGFHHLSLRRYDLVLADLDRLAMDDPAIATSNYWRLWRAVAFVFTRQPVAARRTCDAIISTPGVALKGLAVCGFVFGRIGDASRLGEVRRALSSKSLAGEYLDPVTFAIVAAGERKHDDVLALLEKGAADRSALIIEIVAMPFFDEVRQDRRYAALVQRIGIPVASVSAASQAPQ
jgi:DNA-binding winged helix-turn-helix (wHTH) protein/tetratricopeptide (TPR) repeat protein